MNNLEKIKLIDQIGKKLQSEMTYKEIDGYFSQFGIRTDMQPSFNSKWVYVKEVLPSVNSEIVFQIGEELGLIESGKIDNFEAVANFWKPGYFKLFLSHLSSYKVKASLLKGSLERYCISGFVAHEDIEPTKDWENEIEKGLFTMDALCALLIDGFNKSNWTDQEVGAAIGQKKLVIPIIRDLNPYGFIGKYQGFRAKNKTITDVAEAIFKIVSTHPKTRNVYINIVTDLFLQSRSIDEGLQRINLIHQIEQVPIESLKKISLKIWENEILNHKEVLTSVNNVFLKYDLEQISSSNFRKNEEILIEDIPF